MTQEKFSKLMKLSVMHVNHVNSLILRYLHASIGRDINLLSEVVNNNNNNNLLF